MICNHERKEERSRSRSRSKTLKNWIQKNKRVRIKNLFADHGVLGHLADGPLVVLGQPEGGKEVLLLANVIGLNHGGKNGEAVLGVQGHVKVVPVNSGHLLQSLREIKELKNQ